MLTTPTCQLEENEIFYPRANKYHCSACNKYYDSFNEFLPSHSDLYYANNRRTTICYECANKFWKDYSRALGSKVKGFERLCQKLDIYFHLKSYKAMMDSSLTGAKRIKKYISLLNVQTGRTYDHNIQEGENPEFERVSVAEEKIVESEKEYIDQLIQDFGSAFSTAELKKMDKHRNELMQQLQGDSVDDDIIIKQAVTSACNLLILRDRATETGNSAEVIKITKAYNDTITGKGITDYLKKKQASLGVGDCQGMWIKQIEEHCPAEIWQDKTIYADMRKFKRYYKRHFIRCIKNFLTGVYVPDEEYNIEVD